MVNYRLKIRPIAATRAADDATGGGVPRFKMKNRGNDVFSKVRSNAPLRAAATAAKRTGR